MIGEFDIIERYFSPLSGPEGLGLKDDASCIPARNGYDTIITKDVLVACTHFFEHDEAQDIAFKAVSVNISDLVAKGAEPAFYFVGLCLPRAVTEEWISGFSKGLSEAQAKYGVTLTGGDTTKTGGPVIVSITAVGYAPMGQMIRRSGAQVGDKVYVSGFLGRSAAALKLLEYNMNVPSALMNSYLRPKARIDFLELVKIYATASADISDGILADLGHICSASNVKAIVHRSAVPVSEDTKAAIDALELPEELVWSGGDDYELVYTVSPDQEAEMLETANQTGLVCYAIGEIKSGSGVELIDHKGNLVQVSNIGYQHFS